MANVHLVSRNMLNSGHNRQHSTNIRVKFYGRTSLESIRPVRLCIFSIDQEPLSKNYIYLTALSPSSGYQFPTQNAICTDSNSSLQFYNSI